ncbi:MAG: hypothetical protein VB104_14465 [Candidatus Limiplasma sp.]|nr:hypothetical protein [Candidatus Limiplasma sp.]
MHHDTPNTISRKLECAALHRRSGRFLLFLGIQLALLLILLLSNQIWYILNDDVIMLDIASGGYGAPSPYIVNIHILLGYLYQFLFTLFPATNWVTISYLLAYVGSFIALDWVFSSEKYNFPLSLAVLSSCLIFFLNHFTFTVVAYCACIAGLLFLTDAAREEKMRLSQWGIGLGLVTLGVLFRGEVVKSLMIVFAGEILWNLKGKHRARYIGIGILCIGIMYLGINSNMNIETLNPLQKQGLAWGEIRSAALDCQMVPYDAEKFSAYGLSEEQHFAMYNNFYFDRSHLTEQNFRDLIKLNSPANQYNFDLMSYPWSVKMRVWGEPVFSHLYLLLFAAVTLFVLMQSLLENKKRETHAFAILLTTVLADMLFYFIRRAPYRVLMPNFVFASLLLLLDCKPSNLVQSWKEKLQPLAVHLGRLCILFLVFPIMVLYQSYNAADYLPSYRRPESVHLENFQTVISYLSEHNDNLYLAGDPYVFGLNTCRSVWDLTTNHGFWNVAGNWETYTVPYYQLMKEYNVQNPESLLLEALENEHIKFLTSLGDDFPESRAFILTWLKHFYNIEAKFTKIEDVVKTPYRTWSIYCIREVEH